MNTTHSTFPVMACDWCGVCHTGMCPLVRAIEYHQNGRVKRVEFREAALPNPPSITDTVTIGPPPNTSSTFSIKARALPVGDGWISHPA